MKRKVSLKKRERAMIKEKALQLIDEYGKVNEELKKLQELRSSLREELISRFGYGKHTGTEFVVEITEKREPIIDVLQVYKKLGLKKLLKVVSVSITALRKYLTRSEIEEVTEDYKVSTMVICKRRV